MDALLNYSEFQDRISSHLNFKDSNNNDDDCFDEINLIKDEKYSLRPRSKRKITTPAKEFQIETKSKNTRRSKAESHQKQKPKQKAAPLSKYRRKTANARERIRMREINQAFETLRRVIPHMQIPSVSTNEKLTKITTLRLAMKYISSLSAVLNNPVTDNSTADLFGVSTNFLELDSFLLESDGESLSMSEHSGSLLASPEFLEPSLSPVDFGDPTLPAILHSEFTEHAIDPSEMHSHFTEHTLDSSVFSDFLLT